MIPTIMTVKDSILMTPNVTNTWNGSPSSRAVVVIVDPDAVTGESAEKRTKR